MQMSRVILPVVILVCGCLAGVSPASLVAHYTFDADGGDAAGGGGTATLGKNASIDNATFIVGSGSLALADGVGTDTAGDDGAVSATSFDWSGSDVRTVAFWMQAAAGGDNNQTMISLGSTFGAGARFDVRLASSAFLRLEVQSGGTTTAVDLGNGDWYHVAIVVPADGTTVATTEYYVHDVGASLVAGGAFGGSTTGINTEPGPLRMGDSFQDFSRDFFGHLDDVRLYDHALTQQDAQALALLAIPEPSTGVLLGLFGLVLLRRARRR